MIKSICDNLACALVTWMVLKYKTLLCFIDFPGDSTKYDQFFFNRNLRKSQDFSAYEMARVK